VADFTAEQKANLSAAIWSGFSALMFVTEPAHWPAFAAEAEQKTPGLTWGEPDRLNMRHDAKILLVLAEGAEPRV
jgi:hypothetical protein